MNESDNKVAQNRLLEIKKLGNTPHAITLIKKLLVDFPVLVSGWLELGSIYRRMGDRESALDTYESALKIAPNSQKIKLELSAEQLYFNKFEECEKTVRQLLEINPQDVWAVIRLGELYRKKNKRTEALKEFEKAVKISPRTLWASIYLSRELRYFEKFEEAKETLTKVLEYYPNNFNVLMELGGLEQNRKQPEQALSYFKQAQNNYPNRIEPGRKIVDIYFNLKQITEAASELNKLLEKFPNNFDILIDFGRLERRRDRKEEALKYFELAQQKAPSLPHAINAELYVIEELRGLERIEEALEKINNISDKYPDNIRAKLIYGTLLKRDRDFKAAVELYQNIITLAPKNIQAHFELATCLNELGKTTEALDILQSAEKLSPQDIRILNQIGDLYRKQQDRKQALEYYQEILKIEPQNLRGNLNVAIELRELGKFEAAKKQINKALEYHPNDFNALMQLGQLEQRQQKLDMALEYFQQALKNHPERIEPQLSIIDILHNLGRVEEAKNNLETLQQKNPDNFRILIYSGHFYRKLGQREKAFNWYRLAQEKANNTEQNLESQIFAIEELRDIGKLDRAIELTEIIAQEFPDNIRIKMVRGSIWQRKPDLKKAADIYKNILSTQPNHLNSRIELARVYSQSGQVEKAISILEETNELSGSNIQVLIQLGSLNQALENWETAYKWYKKACQEYPNNPHVYCMLSNLLFLQGETETALKILKQAQKTIPSSPPIYLKIADFQMRLGDFESSHQLLKEALNLFPNNIQLLWQLCRLHMAEGDYNLALETLDRISTDNTEWMRQTEQLRANIYFYQYNYKKAEEHFRKAISLVSIATGERNRLGTILMLTGRIDQARQEFKIATEELNLKTSPGKVTVPLKSHPAMVTNQLRINYPLMEKLQLTQQETEYERILALGSLLAQEPTYLGTSLYLARELREQGIFDKIQQTLSKNTTTINPIPKRIVQFWDDPKPPQEVIKICQSWIDLNPEYEYTLFSLETAILFLKENYNQRVLKAFANCDQPATQADLFRLAYLNKMGGFYADADDLCRQSLNNITKLNPELVVHQEDFSCIGNNFLGCIPGQNIIRTAFHQAVNDLNYYCNESPWFKTGPGLMTSVLCSSLVPYLTYTDYQMWPRLLVLTQSQLRKIINQHIPLAYKRTNKSWQQNAYSRRIKTNAIV